MLDKDPLVFADILLSEISYISATEDRKWNASSYMYCDIGYNEWIRLYSKEYCEKIKVIFGAETISELRSIITNAPLPKFSSHSMLDHTPFMKNCIDIDKIGSMN